MEGSRLDDNFPKDVVFLSDFYRPAGLAENIFDYFGTSFDVLAIFHQQQRNILVNFVAFFGYPKQSPPFHHFVAEFRLAPLVDFDPGVFDNPTGSGAVAVVEQFRYYFPVDDFTSGSCLQGKPLLGSCFDHVVVAATGAFGPDNCLV